MIIVIEEYGINIEKDNYSFKISGAIGTRVISPYKVTAFHIYKPCQISSPAILLAAEFEIPILFLDSTAQVKSMLWQPGFGSISRIRKQQYFFCQSEEGVIWVYANFLFKLNGQLNNLQAFEKHNAEIFQAIQPYKEKIYHLQKKWSEIPEDSSLTKTVQYEAYSSKIYWQGIKSILPTSFKFEKRSKHPAKDMFNVLLNYGYGMLYNQIYLASITAGLDPYLGILHRDNYKTPSFTFDAIEPFRPWVDRLVVQIALEQYMDESHFDKGENEVILNKKGKSIFIPKMIEMLHAYTYFNQKRVKRKDQIQYYLTKLAKDLLKSHKDA
ncbi:MAG: CRISPR-associated endonuclease Cas1 [Chitinophagales bacterium]|nr:CRISPR-associated endonuclease Cas1 [Chitinophagales bacterium]